MKSKIKMILLINPKTTKATEKSTDFFREPNLGILLLAAILDLNDFSVDILDLEQFPEYSVEILKDRIQGYNIFGISCLTNTYNLALRIAKIIKEYDNRMRIRTLT